MHLYRKKMQMTLNEEGFQNYFIGAVEAKPDLEDVYLWYFGEEA